MRLKNLFKMGLGAVRANVFGDRIPLNVMLSVTNRCTSRCSYCSIPSRNQRELTTKEIFNLIDEISKMGAQRLGLWGGEPLLRNDIGEIIDYAKGKNLFVTLDSNGYLFPQKINALKGLDHLILALDGPKEVHDANREKGSFEKAMLAIKTASGRIPFWTITVLTKCNLNSIDFILDKARKYGFLASFQLLHHNNILGRNRDLLMSSPGAYKKAITKIIEEKKKGAFIGSSLKYLYHILNWPDYKIVRQKTTNNFKCWAGSLFCNVDTDGSVYPCSLLIGKIKALNFLEFGFKKAFENLDQNYCSKCIAACFTEYNYLYSLDISTIMDWIKSMEKTRKYLCRAKKI